MNMIVAMRVLIAMPVPAVITVRPAGRSIVCMFRSHPRHLPSAPVAMVNRLTFCSAIAWSNHF